MSYDCLFTSCQNYHILMQHQYRQEHIKSYGQGSITSESQTWLLSTIKVTLQNALLG